MRNFFRICVFVLSYLLSPPSYSLAGDSWREVKGDHFIVYYRVDRDESFARSIAHHAEGYYTRIADELGYPRYSNFWQWENRVKIYIYENGEDFHRSTGEQAWAHGLAKYSTKEIHSFKGDESFMDSILPHEITHLIFRDFVGFKGQVPIWLDEGVAQWQEPAKRAMAFNVARYLVQTKKDYTIHDLTIKDIRSETDEEKVQAYYMQSVTLVDFLVKSYGAQRFTEFCRQLRDGSKFNAALKASYPGTIESLYELDSLWRKYVSVSVPVENEVYY